MQIYSMIHRYVQPHKSLKCEKEILVKKKKMEQNNSYLFSAVYYKKKVI